MEISTSKENLWRNLLHVVMDSRDDGKSAIPSLHDVVRLLIVPLSYALFFFVFCLQL